MTTKEGGLRGSIRNIGVGVGIPNSGNLYAQYDASEINANDGDGVSTWPDSSGNNRDATGGTPTYRTNEINGEPAVDFNGVDDILDTEYTWDTNDPRSIYIVISVSGGNYQYGALDGDNRTQVGIRPGQPDYVHSYADSFATVGSPPSDQYIMYEQIAGSSSSELFENGGSVDTLSYTAQGVSAYSDRIGARNNDGTLQYSDCSIAEILVYQADHGSTARQDVESYLNNKYAVF